MDFSWTEDHGQKGELTLEVGRIYVCDCFDVDQTLRSRANKQNYSIYKSIRNDQLNQRCLNITTEIDIWGCIFYLKRMYWGDKEYKYKVC